MEAKDIEIPYGEEFEVEVDLSGIEGVNEKKVKVLFHEAKSEAGTDFDAHTPDTYKAVYAVEPVSGHPAYRVSRNITVKEPETEAQTKSSSENTAGEGNAGETEDSGNAEEDADSDGSKEIVTDLTEEQEVTTDEESGLAVSEVMDQAAENGIDLYSMEEGEAVTFMATDIATQSTKKVTVTRGTCYQYSDYGYGSYLTYKYTVQFGNVSATAYCVEPSKSSPGSGTYDITKLSDGKKLAKVCYYGTKASGDEGFFTEENGYGNLSAGARFILVHLAASYANGGDSAFSGASGTAKTLAMKLYNYCISQPEIPDVDMSFSDADVTAYVDGNSQRTKEIIFKADELQSITMKLPSGVKLHNVTTGKTSKAGEAVEISGGTKFYLSAPLTQVQDVAGSWSATMKGSVTKDYSAYKISTGSGSQDLALVFGEGVDDEKYVDFKVTWVQHASVKVIKKDAKADAKLAGAVFGLYSDANCTNLITKLPATDANGEASVQIIKTQNTVYLKEITAPTGYRINATAYNVKLEVSKKVSSSRIFEIPVCYGGEYGPDLENIAKHANLTPQEVIDIHSSSDYLIYMLGFLPGFSYLGGLDERIHTPRLANPRIKIPAGSVGIGGSQTGIYPLDSPGGWQLLGLTPVKTYDPNREVPILFEAGDYIRFVPVSESDFTAIKDEVEKGTYTCTIHQKEV